jgi:hypothetical protein
VGNLQPVFTAMGSVWSTAQLDPASNFRIIRTRKYPLVI